MTAACAPHASCVAIELVTVLVRAGFPSKRIDSRRIRRIVRSVDDSPAGDGYFFAAFLAVFLAVLFFAVVFLAARLRVVGPFARFSASNSKPRSGVIDDGSSPRRSVALVSPSVTYGPKRPSLTTTGLSDTGSLPSSFSGGCAARPRRFGSA